MSDDKTHSYVPTLRRQLAEKQISRREFMRTATLLGVSAASASAMAGIGTRAMAQGTPVQGGALRIANAVTDPTNPATLNNVPDGNVVRQTLEFLSETGVDNVTRPYLLESWEPSEDLKSWTLNVRPGVKWADGRDFTADDVEWNIRYQLTDSTGSSVLGLMKDYMLTEKVDGETRSHELWDASAIEKIDDHTIRLNLKSPQIAIPEHLFHYPFAMIDPTGDHSFGPGVNGTGPFRLVDMGLQRNAVYEARDDYWGRRAYVDSLEFVHYGDGANANAAALMSGQVHGIMAADPQQLPLLNASPVLKFYEVPTGDGPALRFRVDQKPFDDPRVRLALKLAVDNAAIAKLALGEMGLGSENHQVSPIHPEYYELPPQTQDLDTAKALLTEAGYGDGLEFEVTVSRSTPFHLILVQGVVEMWKEIGVNAKINLIPGAQYWNVWTQVPCGLTAWAHRPLGIMNIALAYRSGGAWNESGYANPEFDALITQAEGIVDPVERRAVMADIEALLQTDGPMLHTAWAKKATYFHESVGGFSMHPSQFLFAKDYWINA